MADQTKGLPDVDLSPVLDQIQQDRQPQQTQQQTQQPAEKSEDLDLGQFKNPKDLLKSYKEIQGAFTKISQAQKDRERENAELKEQLNIMRLNAQAPPIRQINQPIEQALYEKPAEVISAIAQQEAVKMRIAEVLEEEHLKNPNDFQERYSVVNALSQNPQYVQLCRTGQGVKKLFEIADKFRDDRTKVNARKALEGFFGEPLDDEAIARLKDTVVKKKPNQDQRLSNAYMPDTSMTTRTGATSDQNTGQQSNIDQAIKKGDVDGVLKAKFASILAE